MPPLPRPREIEEALVESCNDHDDCVVGNLAVHDVDNVDGDGLGRTDSSSDGQNHKGRPVLSKLAYQEKHCNETVTRRRPSRSFDTNSDGSNDEKTTNNQDDGRASSDDGGHLLRRHTARNHTKHSQMKMNTVHGWGGIVSTLSTALAIIWLLFWPSSITSSSSSPPTHDIVLRVSKTILLLVVTITSCVTARSGIDLMFQAPISTLIWSSELQSPSESSSLSTSSSFFHHHSMSHLLKKLLRMAKITHVRPPHRDAFRRTALSVYYLCSRLFYSSVLRPWLKTSLSPTMTISVDIGNMLSSGEDNARSATGNIGDGGQNRIDWLWSIMIVGWTVRYFLPSRRDIDFSNGNTYVFVIPMAAGILMDAVMQLPMLQCCNFTTAQQSFSAPDHPSVLTPSSPNDNGCCWNDVVVSELELLVVLLAALVVAFVFTIAFHSRRGRTNRQISKSDKNHSRLFSFDIHTCYWGSALIVHTICWYLTFQAAPFILQKAYTTGWGMSI